MRFSRHIKTYNIFAAIFIAVCVILGATGFYIFNASAAFNRQINYQGKLTDDSGIAVADGTYQIEFNLYTASSGGSSIWTETRSGANEVQVTSGLFSVLLGEVTSLDDVDFNQTLYLGVTIEADAEMTPRKKLGAVPAAFEAQSLGGATSTQYLRSDEADTLEVTSASTAFSVIQHGAGDILNIFDGSNEVFTITDGGSVGIGNVSPSEKLNVQGEVAAQYFTATSTSATSTFAGGLTVDTSDFVVDPDAGRVGIGIATPGAPLHVKSSAGDILRLESTSANNSPFISFYDSSARKGYVGYGGAGVVNDNLSIANQENAGIVFRTNNVDVMTLTASGNLGILDSTPTYKLDVTGDARFTSLVDAAYFTATSTTATSTLPNISATQILIGGDYIIDFTGTGLEVSNGVLSASGGGSLWVDGTGFLYPKDGDYAAAPYFTATSTSATSTFAGGITVDGTDFVVDPDAGRVGIGTNSPDSRLSIAMATAGVQIDVGETSIGGGFVTIPEILFTGTSGSRVGSIRDAVQIRAHESLGSGTSQLFFSNTDASKLIDISYTESSGLFDIDVNSSDADFSISDGSSNYLFIDRDYGFGLLNTTASEAVINELSADRNFRVETNNDANALFVDGGQDRVGIGTSTPFGKLSIEAGAADSNLFYIGDTGSTTIFKVDGSGNVGIGTDSPSSQLDVAGGTISLNGGYLNGDGTAIEGLTVDSGGNVTIRQSTSDEYLTLSGGSGIDFVTEYYGPSQQSVFSVSSAGNVAADGTLGVGTSTPYATLAIDNNAGENAFFIGSSTASTLNTYFLVDHEGNVGIKNSNPSATLDITGTLSATGLATLNGGIYAEKDAANVLNITDGTSNSFTVSTDTGDVTLTEMGLNITSTSDAGALVVNDGFQDVFWVDGFNSRMVYSGLEVGFGISDPQTNFHISESNTNTTPAVEIEQLSTGDAGLQFSISGDAYALGIDNSDSDKFKISYAAGAGTAVLGTNDRFVIDESGNISIVAGDLDFAATKGIDNIAYVKFSDINNSLAGELTMGFSSENVDQAVTWVGAQGGSTSNIQLGLPGTASTRRYTFPDLTGTFAITGAGQPVSFSAITSSYITATSTSATSTLPNLNVSQQLLLGSDYFTDLTGTGLSVSGGVLSVDSSASSYWVDGTGFLYPKDGDYAAAPYFTATSTSATSTFAGGLQSNWNTVVSTTSREAFNVQSGDGTSVFTIDTTNQDVYVFGSASFGNLAADNPPISPLDVMNSELPWLDVDNFFHTTQGGVTGAALQTNTTASTTQDRTINGFNYQITNSGLLGPNDLTIYGYVVSAEHNAIGSATGLVNLVGYKDGSLFLDEGETSTADVNAVGFWGQSAGVSGTSGTVQKVSFAASEDNLLSTGKKLYLEGSYNGSALSLGDTYLTYNSGTSDVDIFANGIKSLSIDSSSVSADHFVATSTSATSTFAGGLTVDTSKFVVDPDSGFIGIGTASPDTTLNIAATAPLIRLEANSGNNNNIQFYEGGALHAAFLNRGSTDALEFINYIAAPLRFVTDSVDRIFIDGSGNLGFGGSMNGSTIASSHLSILQSSGNVGIGNSSPNEKLNVQGEIAAQYFTATSSSDTSTFSGDLTVSGTTTVAIVDAGVVERQNNKGVSEYYKPSVDTDAARGTALSNAVSEASAGDTIYIGPGTYTINNVTIPSNVDVIGAGRKSTIVGDNSDGDAVFLLSGNNHVSNLTLTNTHSTGEAVQDTGTASDVIISNSNLVAGFDVITLTGSASDWIIENSDFDFLYDGGNIQGTNIVFRNITANASPTNAAEVSFLNIPAGTVFVENSHIKITRASNEGHSSFLRAPGAATVVSKNNHVTISSGTKDSYGFSALSFANPTFYSYGDTINLTGANTYHFRGETTINSGTLNYEGGNITTWNNKGTFTTLAQGSVAFDGNVGRFDTTPTYKLDVNGSSRFTSFVDASHFVATSSTASTLPYASSTAITVSGVSYLNGVTIYNDGSNNVIRGDSGSGLKIISDSGFYGYGGANQVTYTHEFYGGEVGIMGSNNLTLEGGNLNLTSGRIGINSGLTYNLDVTGNARFTSLVDASHFVATSTSATSTLPNILTTNIDTGFTKGSVIFADAQGVLGQDNTNFFWDNANNRLGIGTSSPYASLSVSGSGVFGNNLYTSYITATSTTATSTFAGGVSIGNGVFQFEPNSGIASLQNVELGAMSFDTDAGIVSWSDLPVSGTPSSGTVESYSAQIDGTALLTVYAEANGSGGIQNSAVGIATTTPWRTLSVSGTVGFDGLNTLGSSGDAICLTGENEVRVNSGVQTCTVSSLRYKDNVQEATGNLDIVMALKPSTFTYKGSTTTRFGLIAEEVELIDPRLVARDREGTIQSVHYPDLTAVLVGAVQDLSRKIESLGGSVVNGVVNFVELVVGKIKTDELCVGDTCVTETELKAILTATGVEGVQNQNTSTTTDSGIEDINNGTTADSGTDNSQDIGSTGTTTDSGIEDINNGTTTDSGTDNSQDITGTTTDSGVDEEPISEPTPEPDPEPITKPEPTTSEPEQSANSNTEETIVNEESTP